MTTADLLAELCDTHPRVVRSSDGEVIIGREYPLLVLLDLAVGTSGERSRTGGGGSGGTPAGVIDPNALDLWVHISGQVPGGGPLRTRVRSWACADPAAAAPLLEEWVQAIRHLLDPPKRVPLRGMACQQCGHTHVTLDHGGLYPALVAQLGSGAPTVDCLACTHVYDTADLRGLGSSDIMGSAQPDCTQNAQR